MRVLWITNLPLNDAHEYLFHTSQSKEGWLVQLSRRLASDDSVELYVASRTLGLQKETVFCINNIHYFCYPRTYVDDSCVMQSYWRKLYEQVKPNLVHIHGTESKHSADFVQACPQAKTVVSLQGIVNAIIRYYFGGIDPSALSRRQSIYLKIRGISIMKSYQAMFETAKYESKLLNNVKNVIGRTEWDRVHSLAINPTLRYFMGNETMRDSFYRYRWKFHECQPHTIFVTQGLAPYKGFHQILKALSIIKERYQDVILKVALLPNVCGAWSWKQKQTSSEYASYLHGLIKSLSLQDNIIVLGSLSEEEMVKEMILCNVFVSPSAIENSPNSLCEAQLLGMPSLASYVGGTPTIAADGLSTELYRYEEFEMLASKVISLFEHGPDYERLEKARELALVRHNPENNYRQLLEIYREIYEK